MMKFSGLISLVFATGLAAALPAGPQLLESRASGNNCTTYTSPSAGTVCLQRPSDCTATYLVQPGDNCGSIAYRFNNFTESVLYYWNPDIGRSCLGLQAYTPVCINTPWYSFQPPVQQPVGTVEVAANRGAIDQPVPVIYGTSANCAKYELAGPGVYQYNMVHDNGITDEQFYQWNPSVNRSNPQTQAGYWYAVGC